MPTLTWACFFVMTKYQRQLLSLERELDNQEGATIVWVEGFVAFASALGQVHTECDASHTDANVVQWDIFTQERASSSQSK
jgi:hypothetical protein